MLCKNMKQITLENLLQALEKNQHVVTVPEDIRLRAKAALDRMLAL
jgi:quinolinate synthase